MRGGGTNTGGKLGDMIKAAGAKVSRSSGT